MAANPRRKDISAPVLALAAVLLAGPAAALDIYKWTDADGVVHYSESHPPQPTATPVETLRIAPSNSPAYDPGDDYWSILNQAERIGEQWSAIQEEKAAAEEEARAAAVEARIAELERQLAAREAADYERVLPFYGPIALFPRRHHGAPHRGRALRIGHASQPPPRGDRDLHVPEPEPRPGWTRPGQPAVPPRPGFSR